MCGVAGYLERNVRLDPAEAGMRLRKMAAAVAHRGPDDEDVLVSGPVGLAHRRLAIIDPAPHGRQPKRRGPLVIAYNGEIYNYREIRAELEQAGERFETSTDTEVLLAALLRWGDDALRLVNGMFAFALWDERTRSLTLARDKLGKKPLYYAEFDGFFLFGSEIKALLAWPGFPREPNFEAIHHYLSLQYVPTPLTAFEGVHAVKPGSLISLSEHGSLVSRAYWSVPSPAPPRAMSARDMAEAEEKTRALLEASVVRRMVADVPVGAFLSGGVDSSVVAAIMGKFSSRPVKTFSIGFDERAYDERKYARMVADRIGAEHHEELVRPAIADLLPKIAWHYGQPFADPSAVPTFCVSRLARTAVTVALSGDGGDEFFLGYGRYRDMAALDRADRAPRAVRGVARLGAAAISPALARRRPFGGLRRRLAQVGATRAEHYEPAMMYFSEIEKRFAYGERLAPFLGSSTLDLLAPALDGAPSLMTGAGYADATTYLPDDLLVKVDVASMAFGLEARAPFLDVDLVEHAQSLPESTRAPAGDLKRHLKHAVKDLIPVEVAERPKMGFGLPIDEWLRGDLRELASDLFSSTAAKERDLFRGDYTTLLLQEHASGRRQHHTRIWAMLMLELWFSTWIDPRSLSIGGPITADEPARRIAQNARP